MAKTVTDAITQLQCAHLCSWINGVDSVDVLAPFGQVVSFQRLNSEDSDLWPQWAVVIYGSDAFLVFKSRDSAEWPLRSKAFVCHVVPTRWGDIYVNQEIWEALDNDVDSISYALSDVFSEVMVNRLVLCGHCIGGTKAVAIAVKLLTEQEGFSFLSADSKLAIVTFGSPSLTSSYGPAFTNLRNLFRCQDSIHAWEVRLDPIPALFSSRAADVLRYYKIDEYHESSYITQWFRASLSLHPFQQRLAVVLVEAPDLVNLARNFESCVDVYVAACVGSAGKGDFDEDAHCMQCHVEAVLVAILISVCACEYKALKQYVSSTYFFTDILHRSAEVICERMLEELISEDVRSRCIENLTLLGLVGAAELARQIEVEDGKDCIQALNALCTMESFAAPHAAVVADRLGDNQPYIVRQAAAKVMGAMGKAGHTYAHLVVDLLLSREIDLARWASLEVLTAMGETGAVAVARLLRHDDARVRMIALETLRYMGSAANGIAHSVAPLLADSCQDVRLAASATLVSMGGAGADASAYFIARSSEEDYPLAFEVLACIGDIAAGHASAIAEYISHPKDAVRWSAMNALVNIGESGCLAVVPLLKRQGGLFGDSCWKIRAAAAKTLARMGPAGLAHAIEIAALLSDGEEFVRDSAVESLACMGTYGATAVVKHLRSTEVHVRLSALRVLEHLGEHSVSQASNIADLLSDSDGFVRRSASRALNSIGRAGIGEVLRLLKSEDERVRRSAIEALDYLDVRESSSAQSIAELLDDESESVRWIALDALGRLGIEKLKEIADDSRKSQLCREVSTRRLRYMSMASELADMQSNEATETT